MFGNDLFFPKPPRNSCFKVFFIDFQVPDFGLKFWIFGFSKSKTCSNPKIDQNEDRTRKMKFFKIWALDVIFPEKKSVFTEPTSLKLFLSFLCFVFFWWFFEDSEKWNFFQKNIASWFRVAPTLFPQNLDSPICQHFFPLFRSPRTLFYRARLIFGVDVSQKLRNP